MYLIAGYIAHNETYNDENLFHNIKTCYSYKYWYNLQNSCFRIIIGSQIQKSHSADFMYEDNETINIVFCIIHNKQDIAAVANIKNDHRISDEQLFLHAYKTIGNNIFKQCFGKWIFIRIHKPTQQIQLYRDHLGMFCLYFFQHHKDVFFSNHLPLLKKFPLFPNELNKRQLAALLLGYSGNALETSYKYVFKIPAASMVSIQSHALHTQKYWNISNTKVYYKNSEQYYEQFLNLFNRCLDEQMSDNHLTAITLSSGLDSSFLTAYMAKRYYHKHFTAITSIPIHEYINHKGSRRYANEEPLARLLSNRLKNITHLTDDATNFHLLDALTLSLNIHGYPVRNALNQHWILSLIHLAAQKEIHKLFIAQMGNLTISWPFVEVQQSWLKKFIHILLQKTNIDITQMINQNKHFYNSAFLSNSDFTSWLIQENYHAFYQSFSQNKKRIYFFHQLLQQGYSSWTEKGNYYSIDIVDPFADPRIVEFCFSLPNKLFSIKNHSRLFVKKLGEKLLPPEILFNPQKAIQAADIEHRIYRQQSEIISYLHETTNNETINEIFNSRFFVNYFESNVIKKQVFLRYLLISLFIKFATK
ncbi:MAG: asparagine synthase-related protein [Bacteroidales bacterium]|nr:asparagine synthase-related protein [Bacteroidales bacterium]